MNFWSKLQRWAARKQVTSSLDLFREIQGGRQSSSGTSVTVNSALENATVLAVVRVLANGVAQVPFRLYQTDGKSRTLAKEHPLYSLIYRHPNRWQTSFEFRETLMLHLTLTNNAFVFVNRVGSKREIRELVPIEPGLVTVRQLDDDRLEYEVRNKQGAKKIFAQDAIWHLRGPSWNSWMGMDAVALARNAIGLSMALEESHASFHKNGSRVSGLLSVENELSGEEYEQLAAWLDKYEIGGERYNKPMILDRNASFTSTNMTGVDSQHLETRKHQIEEICRAFGVMPIMVGHADKTATYASAEQMFLAHVVHSLSPWYERLEESADINLLSDEEREQGFYIKFTPNALMRGAAKDRAEYYAKALGSGGSKGWLTQNDVRDFEELDRMDDPRANELAQSVVTGDARKSPDGGKKKDSPDA